MPNSTREALGWSEERWTTIQGAIERAIARTAKCRQVVPKGPEKIGEKSVVVPQVGGALPFAYDPDIIATPVHIFVNLRLDDQHINDELAVIRLVEASAARLGALEDVEVIQGGPVGVPAAAAAAPPFGREPRTGLQRARLNIPRARVTLINDPPAPGRVPTGDELLTAIAKAKVALEVAERPRSVRSPSAYSSARDFGITPGCWRSTTHSNGGTDHWKQRGCGDKRLGRYVCP